MSMTLADFGWNDTFAEAFAQMDVPAGCRPMRVIRQDRDFYRVADVQDETLANIAGVLRHTARAVSEYPAVGDWVAVKPKAHGHWVIQAVIPRQSAFTRQAAGEKAQEQVVAANIDVVFLIMGMDANFNLRRLERYLRLAHASGAQPVVLLNKIDVAADPEAMTAQAASVVGDVDMEAISATEGTGLEAVKRYLAVGRTIAFLGSSGVGKSTLVNALLGEERQATTEVGAAGKIGRHTTTARELIRLPHGGMMIDTPGMRELQIWDDDETAAAEAFSDIAKLAAQCRFGDCKHRTEPDCAVLAALESGDLNANRLASYQKQQDELAETAKRQTHYSSTARPSRRRRRRKK